MHTAVSIHIGLGSVWVPCECARLETAQLPSAIRAHNNVGKYQATVEPAHCTHTGAQIDQSQCTGACTMNRPR